MLAIWYWFIRSMPLFGDLGDASTASLPGVLKLSAYLHPARPLQKQAMAHVPSLGNLFLLPFLI